MVAYYLGSSKVSDIPFDSLLAYYKYTTFGAHKNVSFAMYNA